MGKIALADGFPGGRGDDDFAFHHVVRLVMDHGTVPGYFCPVAFFQETDAGGQRRQR